MALDRNQKIILGIIAIALVLFYTGIFSIPQSIIGGNLLSLSSVNLLNSPSAGLSNSTVWQATLVYNGLGSSQVVGTTYTTPPTTLSSGSNTAANTIVVSSTMTSQTLQYPFVNSGVQPQRYVLTAVPITLTIGSPSVSYSCAYALSGNNLATYSAFVAARQSYSQNTLTPIYLPSECTQSSSTQDYYAICNANNGTVLTSTTGNYLFGQQYSSSTGYVCARQVQSTSTSSINYFTPTQVSSAYSVQITTTSNGQTENLVLNQNTPTVRSSDGNVMAQFQGNFVSNAPTPISPNTFTIIRSGGSEYVVLNSIISSIPSFPLSLSSGQSLATANSNLVTYNGLFDNLLSSQNNLLDQPFNYPDFSHASFTFGQNSTTSLMTIDRSYLPAYYPVVTLSLSANYVGIYSPRATVQSISATPNPVQMASGQQGHVSVLLTNGGQSGSLTASIPTCTPGGLNWGAAQSQTVNAGATQSFEFYSSGQQGTYTCTATGVNNDLSSTRSTSFSVNVGALCTLVPTGNQQVNFTSCQLYCPLTSSTCPATTHLDSISCSCQPNTPQCTTNTIQTCSNGQTVTTVNCVNGVSQATGLVCPTPQTNTTNTSPITCAYPSVPVTSTSIQTSGWGQVPIIGSFLYPTTTTTTQSCALDPNLLWLALIGGAVIVLGFAIVYKKKR